MTTEIHAFDGREDRLSRISLTYDEPTSAGRSSAHTDTFRGRFVRLVPNREVVQEVQFGTTDPTMQGAMTIRYLLREDRGATVVTGLHEDLPPGVSREQNELGRRMSMGEPARLVERGHSGQGIRTARGGARRPTASA